MSLWYVGVVCMCSRRWTVDLYTYVTYTYINIHVPERINENAMENVNMRPVIKENVKSMWVQYMLGIIH